MVGCNVIRVNVGKQQHKNPTPTVDTIIQKDSKILLVKRKKDPFKQRMVLPGGFVNEGERVEDAAIREVKEETSLDIEIDNILGVYSDPSRDPRGHIMSTVFIGKISDKSDIKRAHGRRRCSCSKVGRSCIHRRRKFRV